MGFVNWLRERLAHPSMRGLDVDDPRTTELRRTIIETNGFLRQVYESWYSMLLNDVPEADGRSLELGSGGGFLTELCPRIIPSEIFFCPHVQIVLNGERLPFPNGKLSAIVMTNVLHHIPNVRKFFAEAARCLQPGGILAMIEPWNTPWARFIYQHLHAEPFDPSASAWEFPSAGPLSSANGALPWLVFERDKAVFETEFPEMKIQVIQPVMPFQYLVSGGVSMRQLMPDWSYPIWCGIEELLTPWINSLAMFTYIRLRKV
jgi:SAM-dependent methyltransferase